MKSLLVADDEKAISNISEVLKAAGYDVIVYKWLLKALDNIEEISPHLIVISTKDYPRHWKTLAQYSSSITTGYVPEIILYAEEEMPEDELKKAEALRIRGIFDSIEVEGLDKLREIIAKKEDIFSGYLTEPEQGEISLSDIIPELKLKDISDDIDSLSTELNKPFNIDEALAESEKKEEAEDEITEETEDDITEEIEETTDEVIEESEEVDNEITEEVEENSDEITDEVTEDVSVEEFGFEQNEDEEEVDDEIEVQPTPEEEIPEENSITDDFTVKDFEIEESQFEDSVTDEELYTENVAESTEQVIIEEEKEEEDTEAMDELSLEDKLASIMNANKADAKEKSEEAGIDSYSCSFVFTNPVTLAMVTGTARNYNGMTLEFTPDISSFIMNLDAGTQINCASLKIGNEISNVRSEVMSNDSTKLFLQIKK